VRSAVAAVVLAVSAENSDLDRGTPGASARREHQRRKDKREARVHEKHPYVGGLLLALGSQPGHEAAWARGADGEAFVAESLASA
jgi:hypothetical protein